ncbi:MAG: glycosyltransferase, partial [Anaerolineae bacterium]|nr:glycosyltransferase [Anaerolineae bacterium]
MSKISILHLITRLIVGGAQENTMYTAALLDPTRYAVEVISGPQTGSEGSLIEELRARGVALTILPELVREVHLRNDWVALWKLYRRMRAGHYTIVHTHSSKAGILGRLAAKLAGVPVIVHTVHGWSFHDYMSPLVRAVYVLLE